MTGAEFVRRVRKVGHRTGVQVRFDPRQGKGSHGRLYYGRRFTTVKDRAKEISPGLLHSMLRQLELSERDIAA